MAKGHWLVKSEPSAYSWQRLVEEGRARWDGVRNPTARRNLEAMRRGEPVLFYHSGEGKEVVGIARVAAEAYPDPTAPGGGWLAVDVEPVRALARPVRLAEIKADRALAKLPMLRQPRLSVVPLTKEEFDRIVARSKEHPS
jgi:predicted RNA-binding protein with PUA-like domain